MRKWIALTLMILVCSCILQASAIKPVDLSQLTNKSLNTSNLIHPQADAPLTASAFLTNLAKSCPGVGDASVAVDSTHIEVIIIPASYATSDNLVYAADRILSGFAVIGRDNDYQGYLQIMFVTRLPDKRYDQQYRVQIVEATAQDTRVNTQNYRDQNGLNHNSVSSDYFNYVLGQTKTSIYTVPGPVLPDERYAKFGGEREWL